MSTLRSIGSFGLLCSILLIATIVNAENLHENLSISPYPWPTYLTIILFLGIPLISAVSGYVASTKHVLEPASLAISIGLIVGLLFGEIFSEIAGNHIITLLVLGIFVGYITDKEGASVFSPIFFFLKMTLTTIIGISIEATVQYSGFAGATTLIMIYPATAFLAFVLLLFRRYKDNLNLGDKLSNW